ncbi:MAG: acyl-CoA dehydrogenase family protein, partial [Acidiferrobacterales bacterium]
MDIAFSEDVQAFRQEVRAFIRTHLPDDIKHRVERGEEPDREAHMRWHRKLCQKGWTVPNWPTEYGGPGWSLAQQ